MRERVREEGGGGKARSGKEEDGNEGWEEVSEQRVVARGKRERRLMRRLWERANGQMMKRTQEGLKADTRPESLPLKWFLPPKCSDD